MIILTFSRWDFHNVQITKLAIFQTISYPSLEWAGIISKEPCYNKTALEMTLNWYEPELTNFLKDNRTLSRQPGPLTSARRFGFTRLTLVKGAAILLGLLGLLEIGRAFLALFAPVVIDYCEMTVGGAVEQLRQGYSLKEMYAPPGAAYGMPGVQYPPLFILLVWAFQSVSGLGIFLAERLAAWFFYAGAGALVGLIVWKESGQKVTALISAGLPFCFWSVIIFAHAARVDPLALFLSLLAAYCYRRAQPNFLNLALVALVAALAFFSKQTYLAVTAAVFLDLLFSPAAKPETPAPWQVGFLKKISRSSLGKAVTFAGLFVLWVGLGFGLFGGLSAGEIFGIFDPSRAGSFIFDKAPGFVGYFLLDHLPLIGLALVSLVIQWRKRQRFWVFYTLFAALACVTIIKDGAVDYYFNELAYLLALAVGLLVAHLQNPQQATAPNAGLAKTKKKISSAKWVGPALAVQVVIALGMFVFWSPWKDFHASQAAYEQGLALVNQAYREEASGGKPPLVLVDSFLIETGRARQVGDYFIYSVLLRNGKRDATPLVTDLENRRYGLIITETFNRWPPEVEAALAKGYNPGSITRSDGQTLYYVYRPKPGPALSRDDP